MSMLLAFAPFIVFALGDRLLGVVPALLAAALVSVVILARDGLTPGRKVKVLEIGSALLFGGLALYALATHTEWSLLGVRLRVDAGLLLVVLFTMAVRQPFTLQYAKERTPPEVWTQPGFRRVNDVITAAWAVAFALMVLAHAAVVGGHCRDGGGHRGRHPLHAVVSRPHAREIPGGRLTMWRWAHGWRQGRIGATMAA
ncbi:hypothetical protein [Variovorax paradoxus]|uniref:Uncharacterized protein n=1 Tax=Variovorax paradoxus TaxID=34073 RepID=A0A679IWV6_VARPD|nr:hypothetical protein VVAX_00535 [Variovorax paradoxus]